MAAQLVGSSNGCTAHRECVCLQTYRFGFRLPPGPVDAPPARPELRHQRLAAAQRLLLPLTNCVGWLDRRQNLNPHPRWAAQQDAYRGGRLTCPRNRSDLLNIGCWSLYLAGHRFLDSWAGFAATGSPDEPIKCSRVSA